MKRYIAWMLAALLAAGMQNACLAAADGYWTTNDDLYYHLDAACTGAERMFPISQEAAVYFDKLACPQCVGGAWQPYYTGDFGDWPYEAEPWALTAEGLEPDAQRWAKRYQENTASPDKLDAAFKKYGMQEDYCGRYYSVSGDLVIAITNPTIERAEQYAQICGGDIWVIEAEYSMDTLASAQAQMYDLIEAWNAQNEKQVRMMMSSYGNDKDYVEAMLDGRGVIDFMAAMKDSLHPALQIDYRALDARESAAIPREPQTRYDGGEYVLSMVQDSYPVGTKSIGVMLESSSGSLLNYEMKGTLYKYADAAVVERLQAQWKGDYNGRSSVFRYADEGCFVELASDFGASDWGTVGGVLYREWDLSRWDALGEGLYRLDTGMGVLEFTVQADAAPLKMPESAQPELNFTPAAHKLSHSDAASYISDEDPNRADRNTILVGDRIYWVHTVRHSDIEMGYLKSMILCAPVSDLQDVSIVYGPVEDSIHDLVDSGGIIFIEGSGSEVCLKRIAYSGGAAEELARRSGYADNLLMVEDRLYYCDEQRVYSYDMVKSTQKILFETENTIYSGFSIYEGKLVVSVVDWSDYEKGGVYAVDLDTLEQRRLVSGKQWFFMVKDEKLYTGDDLGGLQPNTYQKFEEGLYVCYSDDYTGYSRYALIRWNGERIENLPGGLLQLGGQLYIRDEHGNISAADASIIA